MSHSPGQKAFSRIDLLLTDAVRIDGPTYYHISI